MTKLLDARPVLKGYYVLHGAIRADLETIEHFSTLPAREQRSQWASFWKWFEHHRTMLHAHDRSENDFFFPEFQPFFKDGGGFVEHMHDQGENITALEQRIVQAGQEPSAGLFANLREYAQVIRQHLDDEETICVPIMLEHYTRKTLLPLELRFLRSLPLRELAVLLPWMITRLSAEERQEALSSLPWPIRFVHVHLWEPAYHRGYRFSSSYVTTR